MTEHSEDRILPYSPDQMYALVADVGAYPKFLPWTAAARVKSVTDAGDHRVMIADLVISFQVFRETFTSEVMLFDTEKRIVTRYIDGPFKKLVSEWRFEPHPEGCHVKFQVDFEFKNFVLQKLIGVVFTEAMQRVVGAFEKRAHALYGANPEATV